MFNNWPLTGHGSSQYSSCHPGVQVQDPLSGSQAAPWAHTHVWLQPGPQLPLEQGMEQSTPCQPAHTHVHAIHPHNDDTITSTHTSHTH